jgi:hypothetical protein
MRVDIWSDIVCPWCYIGNARFSRALADLEHRDEIEVVYRSFELDPSIPGGQATPILDLLAAKYGMSPAQARQAEARVAAMASAEGLDFTVDRAMGNTFDAHRLVHLGREHGMQERLLQRLYRAYFGEGRAAGTQRRQLRRSRARGRDSGRQAGYQRGAVLCDRREARRLRRPAGADVRAGAAGSRGSIRRLAAIVLY